MLGGRRSVFESRRFGAQRVRQYQQTGTDFAPLKVEQFFAVFFQAVACRDRGYVTTSLCRAAQNPGLERDPAIKNGARCRKRHCSELENS